jgi:hypothetical protein
MAEDALVGIFVAYPWRQQQEIPSCPNPSPSFGLLLYRGKRAGGHLRRNCGRRTLLAFAGERHRFFHWALAFLETPSCKYCIGRIWVPPARYSQTANIGHVSSCGQFPKGRNSALPCGFHFTTAASIGCCGQRGVKLCPWRGLTSRLQASCRSFLKVTFVRLCSSLFSLGCL